MPPKKAPSKKPAGKASAKKEKGSAKKDKGDKKPKAPVSSAGGGLSAESDFEAGVMFNKYDQSKTGVITSDDFRQMWRDSKSAPGAPPSGAPASGAPATAPSGGAVKDLSFEAGQIFSSFDANNDGKLDKKEFENMVKKHPEVLGAKHNAMLPTEMITGYLLTHYDETGGIAIPRSSVPQHKAMGNTVVPLLDSYRLRYERLREGLTSKLFPKRENLLQLRRQLQNTSTEMEASRKAIERETMADAEQIIHRLRQTESLRQSAIHHQIRQLDVEMESIERVAKRVEVANEHHRATTSGVLITSSTVPGTVPLETTHLPQASLMVELIQQFSDLSATIDRLSTKAIEVQVDFPADDFPKETADRLEIITRCDKYVQAINVKDHMLWTTLQDKDKADELLSAERELSQGYAEEIAEWAQMSQELSQQLSASQQAFQQSQLANQEMVHILKQHGIQYAGHVNGYTPNI